MSISLGTNWFLTETGSSTTVLLPSHSAGDLLLLVISDNINSASTGVTGGLTGWTQLDSHTGSGLEHQSFSYYKIAGASESNPTVTFINTAQHSCEVQVFTGVDNTTPLASSVSSDTQFGTVASITAPSVTTTADNARLVAFVTCDFRAITVDALMTEISNNNANVRTALAYEDIASAGATGTRTFTPSSNDEMTVTMFALNPATTGPVKPVLSSPTGAATGTTTASGTVTTNTAEGTTYRYTSTSATPPSEADHIAGTGAAAYLPFTTSVTGVLPMPDITGLTQGVTYYNHYRQVDADPLTSDPVTSVAFTPDVIIPTYGEVISGTDISGQSVDGALTGKSTRRSWYVSSADEWHGVFPDSTADNFIFTDLLGTQTKTSYQLDDRDSGRIKTYWDDGGEILHVVSAHDTQFEYWQLSYSAGTYTYDVGDSSALGDVVTGLAIEPSTNIPVRDEGIGFVVSPNGNIFVANMQAPSAGYELRIQYSTNGGTTWLGSPLTLASANTYGCTDAVVYNDGSVNKVLIFASENGNGGSGTRQFHCYTATESSPGTWTEDTNVPALPAGDQCDDHCCLCVDSSNNVYVIAKTEGTGDGNALKLAKRDSSGTWSSWYTVWTNANNLTRPVIAIKHIDGSTTEELIAVAPYTGDGQIVYYKTTALDTISFTSGLGSTLIEDTVGSDTYNDVMAPQGDFISTSDSGIVFTASDTTTNTIWVNQLAITPASGDTTAPTLGGSVSVSAASTTQLDITYPSASDDTAITSYILEQSDDGSTGWTTLNGSLNTAGGTHNHTGLSASQTKYYRVTASDAAPNSVTSAVASGTTDAVADISIYLSQAMDTTAKVNCKVPSGLSTVIEYADNTGFTSSSTTSASTPDASSKIAKFSITGLTANTQYYYRAIENGITDTRYGSFKTMQPAGTPQNIKFVTASCAISSEAQSSPVNSASNSQTFANALARNPDFVMHTGDFGYFDISTNDETKYWQAFDYVLSKSNQKALYENAGLHYIYDDHDYGINNAVASSTSKVAAAASHREYFPATLNNTSGSVERSFTYGRVKFIMLDTHYEAVFASETALGAVQLAWFKSELTAAAADSNIELVVVEHGEPWIATNGDAWDQYAAERTDISNHIWSVGLQDKIVFLAGDMHACAVNYGSDNNYDDLARAGWPCLQSAPWDQTSSIKGGPWDLGPYPASASTASTELYSVIDITDDGVNPIQIDFNSYDDADVLRLTYTYTLANTTKTYFTIDAPLNPDSPFYGVAEYSGILSGFSCVYDTQSTPSGTDSPVTISMSGDGVFTGFTGITEQHSFGVRVYDASGNLYVTLWTIYVDPVATDISIDLSTILSSTVISNTVAAVDFGTLASALLSSMTVNNDTVSADFAVDSNSLISSSSIDLGQLLRNISISSNSVLISSVLNSSTIAGVFNLSANDLSSTSTVDDVTIIPDFSISSNSISTSTVVNLSELLRNIFIDSTSLSVSSSTNSSLISANFDLNADNILSVFSLDSAFVDSGIIINFNNISSSSALQNASVPIQAVISTSPISSSINLETGSLSANLGTNPIGFLINNNIQIGTILTNFGTLPVDFSSNSIIQNNDLSVNFNTDPVDFSSNSIIQNNVLSVNFNTDPVDFSVVSAIETNNLVGNYGINSINFSSNIIVENPQLTGNFVFSPSDITSIVNLLEILVSIDTGAIDLIMNTLASGVSLQSVPVGCNYNITFDNINANSIIQSNQSNVDRGIDSETMQSILSIDNNTQNIDFGILSNDINSASSLHATEILSNIGIATNDLSVETVLFTVSSINNKNIIVDNVVSNSSVQDLIADIYKSIDPDSINLVTALNNINISINVGIITDSLLVSTIIDSVATLGKSIVVDNKRIIIVSKENNNVAIPGETNQRMVIIDADARKIIINYENKTVIIKD